MAKTNKRAIGGKRPAEEIQKQVPSKIEDAYKLRPYPELILLTENMDLALYPREQDLIIELWKEGVSLPEMAETLNKDPDVMAIILICLAKARKIRPRKGGAFGSGILSSGTETSKKKKEKSKRHTATA